MTYMQEEGWEHLREPGGGGVNRKQYGCLWLTPISLGPSRGHRDSWWAGWPKASWRPIRVETIFLLRSSFGKMGALSCRGLSHTSKWTLKIWPKPLDSALPEARHLRSVVAFFLTLFQLVICHNPQHCKTPVIQVGGPHFDIQWGGASFWTEKFYYKGRLAQMRTDPIGNC